MNKIHTGRYGLFGHPVAHSRSPAIHAAFAKQMGFTLNFELLDVSSDGFVAAIKQFFAANGQGCNITLPHKRAAFELADTLSDRARNAGAVNTIKKESDGRLLGDNTDGAGLLHDMVHNHGITIRDKHVLVCGAGGAAHGILHPLLNEQPVQLFIANRTPAKAVALAKQFAVNACSYNELAGKSFDLIINATAASLDNTRPPLPDNLFAANAVAYDLVYADATTLFLSWAKQQGATKTLDGRGMLVEQAAESFQLWYGVRPHTTALISNS